MRALALLSLLAGAPFAVADVPKPPKAVWATLPAIRDMRLTTM